MRPLLMCLLLCAASPATERNPQVDFPGFQKLTSDVRPARAKRLIPFDRFIKDARKRNALLLDARSRNAFEEGHIKGAVNLPLTDFTAESLAEVIGKNRNRPIYIYCNNNFRNHTRPVPLKAAPLALNIQTFINLVGYGYPNVWEMADIVDFNEARVEWSRQDQSSADASRPAPSAPAG